MKRILRPLSLALLVVALAFLAAAPPLFAASERILNFQSDITVHENSAMTVTETITVRSARREIKRGIVRDFPTTYRDRAGNPVTVGFKVLEVLRDGKKEPYHIRHVVNGVKIFIGRKNVFLPPGVYTYTIKYRTDGQLGYFPDFDELYWNVTGNGWTFAIDRARAVIDLPPGTKILKYAGYTGAYGAQGKDYAAYYDGGNSIAFQTTRPLNPHEGLTVAVSWPKGLVRQPTFLEKTPSAAPGLAGLAILLGFYLFAWVKVGKDPKKGTIIPLFAPPRGFSPGMVRYLMRLGFDHKAFAAAVVDMAVKGYLVIQEDGGDYTLRKKGANPVVLSRGEQRLADKLFGGRQAIELKDKNHTTIKGALDALKKNLRTELEKVYFFTNSRYLAPGIIITLLALVVIILSSPDPGPAAFGSLWLGIWTTVCFFLALSVYRKWQAARGGPGKIAGALFLTLFSLPFFAGEVVGLTLFTAYVSWTAALIALAIVFLNPLFYHLLKAPTLSGRQIMDQIEGFKLYLSVAEAERLEILHPPNQTPELYEKYLPYALALDVENQWSEQFAEVLAQAQVDGRAYSPTWYSGRSWDTFDTSGFASSLGSSFSGAIASSSSPPGSSSGSGGGGFSGGGGGGGGGSGW